MVFHSKNEFVKNLTSIVSHYPKTIVNFKLCATLKYKLNGNSMQKP